MSQIKEKILQYLEENNLELLHVDVAKPEASEEEKLTALYQLLTGKSEDVTNETF